MSEPKGAADGRKRGRKLPVLGFLFLLLLALGMAGIRYLRVREKDSAPLLPPAPVSVRLAAVGRGTVTETRHFLGEILGAEEAKIAPRVMARVLDVRVREGDRVRRGDLLVRLDDRELVDAVAAAEAAVAAAREGVAAAETAWQAQKDATARDRVLYENDALAREQWDRSRARERAARAALEAARGRLVAAEKNLARARTRLGYTRITAPFDGLVSGRLADPGDLAVPGRPLVGLVREGGVRVRVGVPETLLPRLGPGTPATIQAAADGAGPIRASVSRVFPAVGPDRLGRVEIDVPSPVQGMVPGGSCGVDLVIATADGRVVPTEALLEGTSGTFVVTVAEGKAHPVEVRVVARDEARVVVEPVRDESLREGTPVVVGRPSRLMLLAEGTPVREVDR